MTRGAAVRDDYDPDVTVLLILAAPVTFLVAMAVTFWLSL